MESQEKIIRHFEGKVVRKDLTSLVKGNAVVPTYVLEYLLGQYCAINDEEIISNGLEKVRNIIKNNYVHRSDAEIVKSTIRQTGGHKIIDKLNVSLNDKANIYEAEFANLGLKHVPIADKIVTDHKKLLSGGGVWSIITMGYSHAAETTNRWIIIDLKPVQVANVNVEEYIEARKHFTDDEWLDLLLHTIGLNPEFFNRRAKFIQISRLIPHVENNYNFIELGPKGTGKSHIFQELSPHGVLVSGGDVSKARLFVNNTGNRIGLVGYWDVVALDEFEQDRGGKRVDGDLVKIMQNYMANQAFNRGKETFQATASLAFVGNTKRSVPFMLKNSHLFESIPDGYIKGAFLDRMHLYIPGWEVRILKTSVFSKGFGFIVDYLAEILRELRKADFSGMIDQEVTLNGSLSARDKTAIRKSFSGLMKLLYPHKEVTKDQFLEILDFAIEGRKRVKDQLYIFDETFLNEPVEFSYIIKSSGIKREPETLEKLNYAADIAGKTTIIAEEDAVDATNIIKECITKLEARHISLKDNQTGVSYQRLFADYLRGASEIIIQDPYIRLPYQFRNLMEFCVMLSEIKSPDEEILLKVITWNTEEYMKESIANFEEISETLLDVGIHLTYEFEQVHDRSIQANNGWKIALGRGLDIFDRVEGRFNIAEVDQTKRKCKACDITFIKVQ